MQNLLRTGHRPGSRLGLRRNRRAVPTSDGSLGFVLGARPSPVTSSVSRLVTSLMLSLALGLSGLPTVGAAAPVGGDFELTDQNGQPWSTQAARGQVVLLSFGYTFCPDICPTTLATVNAAMDRLGTDATQVQPVFVSLDPERDTPERLHEYVNWFDPRLIGLTGSTEALAQIADRYRVRYARVQAADANYYTLDHSASLYLLDRNGELARMLPHGLPTDALVDAIAQLLREDPAPSAR